MPSAPLTATDAAIGLVVLVSALIAWGRGFVHEVLAVGGWVGAIVATVYGFPYARPYARAIVAIPWVADFAAGTILFVVSVVVFSILTRAVSRRVQASAFNVLDRSLGLLFGAMRGAVLISLAYIPFEWVYPAPEQPLWLRQARAMPLVEAGAGLLRSLVPGGAVAGAQAVNELEEKARQALESQRILRDMLSVEPKGKDADGPAGYTRRERSDMERLIETSP